jgi:DNA-binding transcriptional LysR family regulator
MRGSLQALDLRRLKALERVAAHASFSRAADELHFTQSAVSQQIASLERDVGVRLINRNPVSLTAPGRMLCDRYASALAELAAAEAELESFREGGSGRLRISAVGAGASRLLPGAAAAFAARFPAVAVHIHQDEGTEALARLKRGEADIALTFGYEEPAERRPRLRWLRLTRERVFLAVPASHPYARKPAVSCAGLRDQPFVYTPHVGFRLEAIVEAAGASLTPTAVFAGENPDAAHAMVAEGMGLALVPEFDRAALPGVEHVRLIDPPLTRSIYAAVLDSRTNATTVGAMLDELVVSSRRAATNGWPTSSQLWREAALAER